MNRIQTRLLAALAVSTGLVTAFANWFLVDPLHLRGLSTPLRGAFTVLAGLALGGLLFLSARAVLRRWNTFRLGWLALALALVGGLLYLALPLQPAGNRYTTSLLVVKAAAPPESVWLERISVAGKPLVLNQCNQKGTWDEVDGALSAPAGQSASLTCALIEPRGTPVEVVFGATRQSASVSVSLEGRSQRVDLSTPEIGRQVQVNETTHATTASALATGVRLGDVLLLILLGLGMLQIEPDVLRPQARAQAARMMTGFNAWFDDNTPRFQKLAVGMGLLTTGMSAFLLLQPVMAGLRPSAAQRSSSSSAPNVLFILIDALSANDLSMFGYSLPTTPHLKQITQDWTVYTNAQSPQTCTVSALPAFMTGRYPYTNDFSTYGDLADTSTGWLSLPQALKSAGYQTWWTGYNSPGYYHLGTGFENGACRRQNGLHAALNRSWFKVRAILKTSFPFIPYTLSQQGIVQEGREDFNTCEELNPLEDLLQTQSETTPFFIYYHYRGVHGFPYPSGNELGAFLPLENGLLTANTQHGGPYPPEEQHQVDQLRLRYDEAIADQDRKLSDLFDLLKQRGLYDSTMIVITGDHGQSFNNGFSTHCTSLVSHAETHVPLLIKYPHQTQGQRIDDLVSTVDIAPTVLDAAGFTYPKTWFDGVSLLQPGPANPLVFSRRAINNNKGVPADVAVTDGQYRLVMRKGQLFLFDFKQDPLDHVNLLQQNGYAYLPAVNRLRQALENFRQRAAWIQQGKNILNAPPLIP